MNNNSIISFNNVDFYYQRQKVINNLSIDIAQGQILSLVGPSGCGKTTLLRLAAGLDRPSSGQITISNNIVADDKIFIAPQQRQCGLVFQDFALFPHFNVEENIAYGLRDMGNNDQQQVIDKILSLTQLQNYRHRAVSALSGGQQQRVALARALAPKPKLLLLDEPFSGLDTRLRDELRDWTLHLIKTAHISAILVTHDPEEAMAMADEIALMRDGHIEQHSIAEDMYQRPASKFVAEFFSETNYFDSKMIDGVIQSPFGRIRVDDVKKQCDVEVIVRPESIVLSPCREDLHVEKVNHVCAEVMEVKFLGRTSVVHLSAMIDDKDKQDKHEIHFHARIQGISDIKPHAHYRIELDDKQLFVFDKSSGQRLDSYLIGV